MCHKLVVATSHHTPFIVFAASGETSPFRGCSFSPQSRLCGDPVEHPFPGNRKAAVISFSTSLISLSSSGELALSASSPSFSRQRKRASGGIPLGSYPNALCLTYSVVLSPHFRAFDCILSFSFAVTRTAIRISFIYNIPSFIFFRGIGGSKPPKNKAARKSAAFDWDFGTQSPCLLYRRTRPAGQKEKRLSDTGILAYLCAIRYRKPLPCPLGHIFL